jgi:hypothetical protein
MESSRSIIRIVRDTASGVGRLVTPESDERSQVSTIEPRDDGMSE